MKKTKATLLLLLCFLLFSAKSQITTDYSALEDYDWDDLPAVHTPDSNESKDPYFYVKHYQAHELFTYNSGAGALKYFLKHNIIHLNTKEGIDYHNKVYVPAMFIEFDGLKSIIKARVIKANGDVKELDEEDILEAESDNGSSYKYFAMEGLEVGDEVEYLYLYYSFPSFNGTQVVMQKSVSVRESMFEFYCPPHIEYKFKNYNNFAEVKEEEDEDYIRYYAIQENGEGLPDEKYITENANLGQIIYYFNRNNTSGTSKDVYNDITKGVGALVYGIDPKKSKLVKFINSLEINDGWKTEKKIRFIEDHIKSTYYVSSGEGSSADVKEILKKKKLPNEIGMVKLFAATYRYLNIPFEVVFTSDRDELTFDDDFECLLFAAEPLIYFTKTKKYMSPSSAMSRYGFPPSNFIGNRGLFVRFKEVAGVETTLSKIKEIKPPEASLSNDIIRINVNAEDPEKVKVELNRELTGYNASLLQTLYNYLTDEQKEELTEQYVYLFDEDLDLGEMEVKNTEAEDFGKKPLIINADFESEIFVSKAGNKYLLNVGKMIGPQSELYQSKPRVMPVSNSYNRSYEREITLTIPEGYKLGNLDSLKTSVEIKQNGEVTMSFVSTYSLEKNVLKVTVKEFYNELILPVDRYEEFQSVINAAADFNKKVIVLTQ